MCPRQLCLHKTLAITKLTRLQASGGHETINKEEARRMHGAKHASGHLYLDGSVSECVHVNFFRLLLYIRLAVFQKYLARFSFFLGVAVAFFLQKKKKTFALCLFLSYFRFDD